METMSTALSLSWKRHSRSWQQCWTSSTSSCIHRNNTESRCSAL